MNKHVLQLSGDSIKKFYPHTEDECPAKNYITVHVSKDVSSETLQALGKMAEIAKAAIEKGELVP